MPGVAVVFEAVVHHEVIELGVAGVEGEVALVDTDAADTRVTVGKVEHLAVDPSVEGVVESGVSYVGEHGFHAAAILGYGGDFAVAAVILGIVDVGKLSTAVEYVENVVVEEQVEGVSSRFHAQIERRVAAALGHVVVELVGHDVTALDGIVEGLRSVGSTHLYVGFHVLQGAAAERRLQGDGLRTDVLEGESARIFTYIRVVGVFGVVDQCSSFGQNPGIFGLSRSSGVAQGYLEGYLYIVDHAHRVVLGLGDDGGFNIVDEQRACGEFSAHGKFYFILSRQVVGVRGVGFGRGFAVAELPSAGTRESRGIGKLYRGPYQVVEFVSFVGDAVGKGYIVTGINIVGGIVFYAGRQRGQQDYRQTYVS